MQAGNSGANDQNDALSPRHSVPTLEVMRSRVVWALIFALVAVVSGLVGIVTSIEVLVLVAAISSLAGGVVVAAGSLLAFTRSTSPPDVAGRANVDIDAPVPLTGAAAEASVIDHVTGFPDGRFFDVAVEGRVAAARRHLWPVSIVLVQLGFDPESTSEEARDRSLRDFANLMRQTLREADIACRLDATVFGLILEDTSEEGGVWTAERLQIALSHDVTTIKRLVAGVAAYPTHGLFAKDVMIRAQAALKRASSTPTGHGLGQVEVAHVDLS